ncbi:MAG: gas vesicle protein GvpD [Candidatus Aenigmarchaeota archaeon]|nr:gas vesicle protein GvpD [Candidatus Aenigmarchaeota archaeon]
MVIRVPTGIKGFDELVGGGFIPSSAVMIGGKAGTGKTLFCAQFLYTGALYYREPGIYVTLEERVEDIRQDIKDTFGWSLDELENRRLLFWLPLRIRRVWHPTEKREVLSMGFYQITQKIIEAIDNVRAKRIVIDPLSAVEMMYEDKYMVRSELVTLLDALKERGVVTLFVAEIPETESGLSRSEFLEFIADAVIKLDFLYLAKEYQRTITIKKMRRSKHSTLIHPFLIGPNGIEVLKV